MQRLAFLLSVGLALLPTPTSATQAITVHGTHIELGEVLPNAPQDMKAITIARAPRPGASRLLAGSEIVRQVKAAGFSLKGLSIPSSVRVKSPGQYLAKEQVAEHFRAAVAKKLPRGATLLRLSASASLTISPECRIGAVHLTKLPKRMGAVRSTVTVELMLDGEAIQRVPLLVVIQLDRQASRYDVERGSTVRLTIQRRTASISAEGTAVRGVDIGEIAAFKVKKTGRLVKARLLSRFNARVVEGL